MQQRFWAGVGGPIPTDRSTQRSQVNGLKTHSTTRGTEKHSRGREVWGVQPWMDAVGTELRQSLAKMWSTPTLLTWVLTPVGFKSLFPNVIF